MQRILLWCLVAALAGASPAFAQTEQPQGSTPSNSATPASQVAIESGTKVSATLDSALDARTAKPGDEVAARVTKDVKQDGRVVIRKGDRLLGRVVSTQGAAESRSGSSLALTFDRLQTAQGTTQLRTVVSSVLSTPSDSGAADMTAPEPMPMPAPRPATASGGGGLLGGVGATVGSTVDTTVGGVGSVAGSAGGIVNATSDSMLGSATGATLSTPARMIQVQSQSAASQNADATSTLTARQGDLRLDSGTRLEFRVTGSAAAESPR